MHVRFLYLFHEKVEKKISSLNGITPESSKTCEETQLLHVCIVGVLLPTTSVIGQFYNNCLASARIIFNKLTLNMCLSHELWAEHQNSSTWI